MGPEAWRWKSPWFLKYVMEIGQQKLEKILVVTCMEALAAWPSNTLPHHMAIRVPKGHRQATEVPYDWSQCAQPLSTKHHIVATQWQDEQMRAESCVVHAELSMSCNAGARNMVTIGDHDMQAGARLVFQSRSVQSAWRGPSGP